MNPPPTTLAPPAPGTVATGGLEHGPVTAAGFGLEANRTAPRYLVHKLAVHEVLLSEYRRLGETEFALTAQLPAMHAFYCDGRTEFDDLMLLVELLRQSGILLAHEYHEIPFGHMFVFRSLDFEVHDVGATRSGGRPRDVLLLADISDKKDYKGVLGGYVISTRIIIDGIEAASGAAGVNFMAPDAYAGFRAKVRSGRDLSTGRGPALPPADPRVCGKHDPRNAVLSHLGTADGPWETEASVLVDLRHRCLFDHELDHIPGMLLLEAAKQMALATLVERGEAPERLVPIEIHGAFTTFSELELPLRCRARVEPGADPGFDGHQVAVELLQPDMTVTNATVRVLSAGAAEAR
jgi:hypothetical protein